MGRFCAAAPVFEADGSATLALDDGDVLRMDLHPERGWIRTVRAAADQASLAAKCTSVEVPPDERYFSISLTVTDRFDIQTKQLFVELHTNQWNVLVVESGEGRILSALRARNAGRRTLRPGAVYEPPGARLRAGTGIVTVEDARAAWSAVLGATPPEERRAAALRGLAYMGTLNVDPVLGEAVRDPSPTALAEAFFRWWELVRSISAHPVLLQVRGKGAQPYPFPLDGFPSTNIDSLLAGMTIVAERVAPRDTVDATDRRLRQIRRRADAAERRASSLRAELESADGGEILRSWGDLLLAHMHRVPHGAASVVLPGWEGDEVVIELDPTLSPSENANSFYAQARRHARARERLPAMIDAAEAETKRWLDAEAAVEAGEDPAWLAGELTKPSATGTAASDEPNLPYRSYRTSGGLEVRVGRNSKDNDRLTFHNSRPDDVWLHAQSVPGSHVILRWTDQGAPPARDLGEAAALAALFSKARSSSIVAVDWTRRKHVRKPRGAAPGAVIPQRVKTVFAEPDPALEDRLRTF